MDVEFTGFPKYRDGGVEIVYTITEDAVEHYETTITGYNVTNSYTPETVDIAGGEDLGWIMITFIRCARRASPYACWPMVLKLTAR